MISKSKKGNRVIGRKVRAQMPLRSFGGAEIKKDEVCEIFQKSNGYGIKTEDGRIITAVHGYRLSEIINKSK